jgi:hypothetical protein
MLLQVRIRLADRPGSLGRVTWTLGVLGADIHQVVVLGRESGRAIDDFTIELPGSVSQERLITTLQEIPGVMVDGVWPALWAPGMATEVAVIGQVAADPGRGHATLVDALPRLFGADWAALVTSEGLVLYGSIEAPREVAVPEPVRPRAFHDGEGGQCAMVPFSEDPLAQHVVVVSRTRAPGFHPAELDRLFQVVGATATVLAGYLVDAEPGAAT